MASESNMAQATGVSLPGTPPTKTDTFPEDIWFKQRIFPTFGPDAVDGLGIVESLWTPKSEADQTKGLSPAKQLIQTRRQLSISHLRGFEPTRLAFRVPHPEKEMNDDWFELLFVTLRNLLRAFCKTHFASELALFPDNAMWSPWETVFSSEFLAHVNEVARKDDSGWDVLLIDPTQRSFLVMGVVAKILEEHVLSKLLFGAEKEHRNALAVWDQVTIRDEGYFRKARRAEEVRLMLDNETLTPLFWDDIGHLTARITTMLLPLLNLQRRLATAPAPGIVVLYQQLHDIVAVAGYLSICMARSSTIFQVDFLEPGRRYETEQERVGDEAVFWPSVKRAIGLDGTPHDPAQFHHAAKVKIVIWPIVHRNKPHWDSYGSRGKTLGHDSKLGGATVVVLTKSQGMYYAGEDTDDADFDEGKPTLAAHVRRVRARRFVSRFARLLAMALILIAAFELFQVMPPFEKARLFWKSYGGHWYICLGEGDGI